LEIDDFVEYILEEGDMFIELLDAEKADEELEQKSEKS